MKLIQFTGILLINRRILRNRDAENGKQNQETAGAPAHINLAGLTYYK